MATENYSFALTGDPEADAKEAASIERSMRMRDAGLCPNDGYYLEPTEPDTKVCPKCGFTEVRSTLYVG